MRSLLTAVVLSTFLTGSLAVCPDGWLRVGTNCYWLSNTPVTFEDAQGVCAAEEGSLVSLATSADRNGTMAVLSSSSAASPAWACLRFDPNLQQWAWLDGATYNVTAVPWWGGHEPALSSGTSEACAALDPRDGSLHRLACTDTARPLCSRSVFKRQLCKEEDGWRAIGGACYKTFTDPHTYRDAQHTCHVNSATLLQLPFSESMRSVIQQSVVCDTPDNDVWVSTPGQDVTTTSQPAASVTQGARCNYVSVQFNRILVQGLCLTERRFICVKSLGTCAEGWTYHEAQCYRSTASQLPWHLASQTCTDQGAQLLTISSASQQDFVHQQMVLGNFQHQLWLGFSDTNKDGQLKWVWGDSVPANYVHWGRGYPVDTPQHVDCGAITLGRNDSLWSDGYCYASRSYVCEMYVTDVVHQTNHWCEPGWTPLGHFCYKLGPNRNYTDASTYCLASGGTLAAGHTHSEQAAMAAMVSSEGLAWIGLRRYTNDQDQHFVWADDGTTVAAASSNWLPGEPTTTSGPENCVAAIGVTSYNLPGAWKVVDCGQKLDFICQKNPNSSDATANPNTGMPARWSERCGEGWLLSDTLSACYKLVSDVTVTWPSARAQCRRHGGDLASITSHRELTQLEVMARSAGLDVGTVAWSGIWIGATDNTREGGWGWVDGAPFRYLHWSAGQPDNTGWGGEEQDCAVAMPANELVWDDRDCGETHNYFCKKPAAPAGGPTPVPASTSQPTGQCQGSPMLAGEHSVTDSMLYSSSHSDSDHGPEKSRLYPGNLQAWQSGGSVDSKPWISVHFETLVTVKGVTTAGGAGLKAWVATYTLQYRYDTTAPAYWYKNPSTSSSPKEFIANTDSSSPVTHYLELPFVARQVYLYPTAWNGSAAAVLRWELLGCLEDECTPDYAVSGPLIVPDANMTASSTQDSGHSAARARLHRTSLTMTLSCWIPQTQNGNQWIQVDFERVEVVRGISIRGNPAAAEWVTRYLLMYHDGQDFSIHAPLIFKPYEEPYGSVRVFYGNTNNRDVVTRYLRSHVPTRHIRLQPQAWNGRIALQFDVLVCQTGCQEQPLLRDVPDEQLTATSWYSDHSPATSRLQSDVTRGSGTNEGWQAQFNDTDQYIQVTLTVPMEIQAVATQGRSHSGYWLTSYSLNFSSDGTSWLPYRGGSIDPYQLLTGNYDDQSAIKHYVSPFTAKYVRLIPHSWLGAIALRWELYGCAGHNNIRLLGCYTDHLDDRDLPYEPYTDPLDGMDPLLCTRHCFGKGYYFAGLQGGDKCFCGNSYGRYGISGDCRLQCFPQQQFTCGGINSNIVYATGLTAGFRVCPEGWTQLGDQCYVYNGTALDWSGAQAACSTQGAELASIGDHVTDQLVYSLMGQAQESEMTWIGLNDLREHRYFEWSNGEEVVYTDWDLHQPPPLVSGENDRCVAINSQTGGWKLADCGRRLSYLCVSGLRTSDEPPKTISKKGCQEGMYAFVSSCYAVVEESRTRDDAATVCAAYPGGQLVTVMNRFEQAFLTSLLSKRHGYYWTDVSDLHNPGRFSYGQGQHDVPFTNWASNMPDSHRHGHCVAMSSGSTGGLWTNQNCRGTFKAICKMPRDGFPQPPVPPNKGPSVCATNWIPSNSSLCYQMNEVGSNLQVSWYDARKDCMDQGGDLASFHDTTVLEDLWRHKLLGSSNHFWIGLHALPSGELQWSDRRTFDLDGPWSPGQPNSQNNTHNCVELHVTSGTLALRDCTLRRNWLCALKQGARPLQRIKDRFVPTPKPPGSCYPLDDSWKRYSDYCYTVINTPATWRQAREACQQHQADLASITTNMENAIVLSLAQKTDQESVWIGLSELFSTAGFYSWSDGSSIGLVNWDGDGPDDANGQESCAEMYVRSGKWNDNHCAVAQGYVCKRDMSPGPHSTPTTHFPPSSGGCGDQFVAFEDRCYVILGQDHPRTWLEAADTCRGLTTSFATVQLASVRSHRESAYLTTQLLFAGVRRAWLGLHLVNSTYRWHDNQELTFTNWDTGEPNGNAQTGCVQMTLNGENGGRWHDVDCTEKMAWICESSRFPYWNNPVTPTSSCPQGYEGTGNSCFRYQASPLPWFQASGSCDAQGAHLVSVDSQVQQDVVYLMVSANTTVPTPSLWLGLRSVQLGSVIRWQWSDGWPLTFTNWAPSYDLDADLGTRCVMMDGNGTWSGQNCSQPRPYVCKITTDTPPYTPPVETGVCAGRDWIAYGDFCYAFRVSQPVSFAHADFACSQEGATLVSVHDSSTNAFLLVRVVIVTSYPVWIGLKRSEESGFHWRDGSPIDYLNFDAGAGNSTMYCTQLSPVNGRWFKKECSEQSGYICVKDKVYRTTPRAKGTSISTGYPDAASVPARRRRLFPHTSTTSVVTSGVTSSLPGTKTPAPAHAPAAGSRSVKVDMDDAQDSEQTAIEGSSHLHRHSGKGRDYSRGLIAGGVMAAVVVTTMMALVIAVLLRRRRLPQRPVPRRR